MSLKDKILILCCILGAIGLKAQSPWVQSRAGFCIQTGIHYQLAWNALLTENASLQVPGTIRETSTELNIAYGFTRKWTGILDFPVNYSHRTSNVATDPPSAQWWGVGNTNLGLKYGRIHRNLHTAWAILMETPAASNHQSALRAGFPAWTFKTYGSIGKQYPGGYVHTFAGGGWRSHQYSGIGFAGVESGWHWNRFWLIAAADRMFSLKNEAAQWLSPEARTGLYHDRQSWWRYRLKIKVNTGRFTGLTVSMTQIVKGEWVSGQPVFSLSGFFKWD